METTILKNEAEYTRPSCPCKLRGYLFPGGRLSSEMHAFEKIACIYLDPGRRRAFTLTELFLTSPFFDKKGPCLLTHGKSNISVFAFDLGVVHMRHLQDNNAIRHGNNDKMMCIYPC